MRKIFSLVLCAVMAFSIFACAHHDEIEQIDETRTQLRVNTFYAGLGDKWLQRYKREFEDIYKDVSFEEGKVGVQVVIDYSYTSGFDVLQSLISSDSADVFFVEGVSHAKLAPSGLALDISSIIDKPLTEYGEESTIISKLDKNMLDYYKASNGKVYMLPWYDYLKGVIYDKDIFEGKQSAGEGFYFAVDGGFTNGLEGSPKKDVGPDGKADTFDDGLPRTHEEFFSMMNHMVQYGIVPFTFPGTTTYADSFFMNLFSNQEGDQMALNFTFDGLATDLINVDNDGNVTRIEPTQLTNENGYMVFKQEGRYRAYQFLEKFVKNNRYYSKNAFGATQSHVQALEDFLYNVDDNKEKIAMTINGIWWEEESSSTFKAMEEISSDYSRQNRRFAWMSMPYYDLESANKGQQQILVPEQETSIVISSKVATKPVVKDLAEKFLQFTSTDPMLLAHAEEISVPRALIMTKPELLEQSTNMTEYGKSIVEIKNNSKIILDKSLNKFQWTTGLNMNGLFSDAIVDGAPYSSPLYSFYNNSSLTAEKYFNGIYNKHAGYDYNGKHYDGMWQQWLENYDK